jgi:hypothetical protein
MNLACASIRECRKRRFRSSSPSARTRHIWASAGITNASTVDGGDAAYLCHCVENPDLPRNTVKVIDGKDEVLSEGNWKARLRNCSGV